MKRRIIKKNINRFITPFIKSLPRTEYGSNIVKVGDGLLCVTANRNHTIINGEVVPEGCRPASRCNDLLVNIRRTGEEVQRVVSTHEHVFLRASIRVVGRNIRVRLITE